MIPKITAGGRSFKGAFRYYLHDKGGTTQERVAWTHTENMLTDEPAKAWKVMAYTAKEAERLKEASGQRMSGRKLTKPVFAYSLSWHPEQDPERDHMLATAKQSLDILGLGEHEAIFVAHQDEPQKHVHIIVNRVHPLTGIASSTGNSKLKLSDFARRYETEHGKVYCPQREENHRQRSEGKRTQYCDPIIAEAWRRSDSGKSFAAALKEKGYTLAQGRKRVVVLDQYGKAHNPTRHLENVRANDLQHRLRDIAVARLPEATALSRQIQVENRRRYDESLKHDARVERLKNHIQDRQHEERAKVIDLYEARATRKKEELTEHYRIDEQTSDIEALREKTRKSNWLKRLLGIQKRQEARLLELERTRQNAEWRTQEKLNEIAVDREESIVELNAAQEARRIQVEQRLEQRKPAGYFSPRSHERGPVELSTQPAKGAAK